MVAPPIIAAGISTAGSLAGSFLQKKGADAQNRLNRELTERQIQFQQKMSNTAYQRAMRDMRKAGLNPILAYQQGGASAPFGAAIPAVNPWAGAAQGFSQAVNSGLAAARLPGEVNKLDAEAAKIRADERLTGTLRNLRRLEQYLVDKNIDIADAKHRQIEEAIRKLGVEKAKLVAELPILDQRLRVIRAEAESAEIYEEFLRANPEFRMAQAVLQSLGIRGSNFIRR